MYRDHLEQIGVDAVSSEAASISAAHKGKSLLLLCFENVEDLGEMSCHRRVFARWCTEKMGQEVPELQSKG